ncbi:MULTISPECIES: NADH-quinone oxidoreductase subunit NuoG [Rhodopseudomonas]|uniref:NADH-quinone oxidoreductase subunit G n=1 Tax=Rhodopseudomonas palustris TaxID=1076 RepID=A0A0D7F3T7_RHOPL|nr:MULTISPECIES: NADH-quinone oxidoreductase subunit NuoG [Rhodopseudomonas]KIZ47481.1 NADH dehydrogenase [Rhodopseudomonas palustris]MDF3813865.1 NADH-quinone oxidoreductase subunit NuoG [Rhodopseudomonas sp. BAL398]WOK15456.1 NADH-quinone oxidoreductase subunit NuoG [Rhodopseudomonas sp. BAL398]
MSTKITIDGRQYDARIGDDLLSVCLSYGIDVPYFCWHGALGSTGACRQCAVRVYSGPDDTEGRIVMSCMTPVAEGQRVSVLDPEAADFRARVIEWLMTNHPHDCPTCEEAGSCHLQDMTIATGHNVRRYRFDKRTHRNQDLGPLLTHEMNRCIACHRCTRFYRDYAGGRDLDAFGAHNNVYFGRAEDGVLDSPFAGNLAEICPTGVFNDKGWSADYARKWDMRATPSICPHCALGCNLLVDERDGRVRRVQNRYHGALNGYFLCDRGRYGPLHVVSKQRLTAPLLGGVAASEHDAKAAAHAAIAAGAIGIGSPRASLESNYALQQLVGRDRFFAGISDAEAKRLRRMVAILRAGPAKIAALAEIESADAVLVLGEDLTNAAPRMALALRQTARGAERELAEQKGVPHWLDQAVRIAGEGRRSPIVLATPAPDPLDAIATVSLRLDPEAIATFGASVAAALRGDVADGLVKDVADILAAAKCPLIIAGASLGAAALVEAAAAIASALGARARIALVAPEANSIGMALLGGDGIEAAADLLASGQAETAIVLENDLFERAPRDAVERLFVAARSVVVLDALTSETSARAAIALPVAAFSEAAGTFVNYEARAQRFFAAVPPDPVLPSAWRRIAEFGAGDWHSLDALIEDIVSERPDLAGIAAAAPGADFVMSGGKVTRAPRPLSGRTADDRAGQFADASPAQDPDSPLTFGIKGSRGTEVPSALITSYKMPGLHSANAVTRFEQEIGGPLRGGDPGALLFEAGDGALQPAAPAEPIGGDGLLLVPLHDVFSGWEPSRASALLAARAPAPRLVLHPDDAAALGLGDGCAVLIDGRPCVAPLSLDAGLARGVVAVSVGTAVPRGPLRRVIVEAAP